MKTTTFQFTALNLRLLLAGCLLSAAMTQPLIASDEELPPALPAPESQDEKMEWFRHNRFGLFIHWGIYAMAARHEWVKSREQMTDQQYERYFKHFDPDLYDPQQWADAAANAGMKYFVVTAKHHDGFCLWDSKHTDFKATNTPAGRDLVRPMVEAFRGRGMRAGLYYSLIDWRHPHYIVDRIWHPQRGGDIDALNKGRDQMKYADYMHAQVRELLSDYGEIDIMWFDFTRVDKDDRLDFTRGKGREAWRSEELIELIRSLQPKILINDRLEIAQDIHTPEQTQPREWVRVDGQPVVWEACQTFSGSWGYFRDEHTWRSTRQLITTLIDCVSKGGNLLLNVGPTGRGEFDQRALDRLAGIGRWMSRHDRAIYGCTQAPPPPEFVAPADTRLTFNPQTNRMYVHLLSWPYQFLHLYGDGFADRVEYAQLLHDGSEVGMGLPKWNAESIGQGQRELTLRLPQREPDGVEIPVVELFLKG